jgi:hypothetical protein
MASIGETPSLVNREINLEQPASELLDDYSRFVECRPDHVANYVPKKLLWRDPEYRRWRAGHRNGTPGKKTNDVSVARRIA